MKTKKLVITGLAATAILGGIVASQAVLNPKVVYADTKAALAPLSHLGVSSGWSNDLQTITWNDARQGYDIYYLRSADGATNVFGSQGQNWEHTFTKDFVTYESQNSAIAANGGHSTEGWKSAWTGGVITSTGNIKGTSKGQKVAYFSEEQGDSAGGNGPHRQHPGGHDLRDRHQPRRIGTRTLVNVHAGISLHFRRDEPAREERDRRQCFRQCQ